MQRKITTAVLSMVAGLWLASAADLRGEDAMQSDIYAIAVQTIDGESTTLASYKGKVLLIVNTASKCGFTGQYAGLQELYASQKDAGLIVLGFPSNDFMGQEPGANEAIKQFCALKYNVSFPMFAKIAVKGGDQHPLYRYLTSPETNPQFANAIGWNFNKYLVGRDGKVLGYFGSRTAPGSEELVSAVTNALALPQ
ncbi:MAG: glutathione peroxidase [Verrucomicrobia bacterium]|nr:glutathione peroxidase [Verrucomicrobiota bacterium]